MNNFEYTPVDERVFLVRHGEYLGNELTEIGIQQAQSARDDLLGSEIGSSSLLLSSPSARALKTAQIIGEGIGTTVISIDLLSDKSDEWVEHLSELEIFTKNLITNVRKSMGKVEPSPVIIVGHEPFIASLARKSSINNGEVIEQVLRSRQIPVKAELNTPKHRIINKLLDRNK